MIIKTKNNRNDKVWIVDYDVKNKKLKPLKIRITDIRIDITCLGTEIQYFTTDTNGVYSEDGMFNRLFKTKAEAQAECDKRNYENKYCSKCEIINPDCNTCKNFNKRNKGE